VRDQSARAALAIASIGFVGFLGTAVLEEWGNWLFGWVHLGRIESVERYGLGVIDNGSAPTNQNEPTSSDRQIPSKQSEAEQPAMVQK
jgi:hypothetical protein